MNNFVLGDTVELKFKLNISGTAAVPTAVQVVLGVNPSVHYTASQISGTDEWTAFVTPVRDVHPVGLTRLSIEVLLAGKLHSVIKREIEINDSPTVNAEFVSTDSTPEVVHTTSTEPIEEPVESVETVVDYTIPTEEKDTHPVDEEAMYAPPPMKPVPKPSEPKPVQPTPTPIPTPAPVVPIVRESLIPKQPKKIELDFKSLTTQTTPKKIDTKKVKEKQVTVNEITTRKTPFTLRKGKIITK